MYESPIKLIETQMRMAQESCDGCDCYFAIKEIEVIGNIHDNPELLEVRE